MGRPPATAGVAHIVAMIAGAVAGRCKTASINVEPNERIKRGWRIVAPVFYGLEFHVKVAVVAYGCDTI